MESKSLTSYFSFKIKLFRFFAFLLFAGLFAIFAYYKMFGEEGFSLASGYFNEQRGLLGLVLLVFAFVLVLVGVLVSYENSKLINLFTGVTLLASGFVQIRIWIVKIIDGLYPGGDVLKSLAVDDSLYFVIYYFITTFYSVYIVVIGTLYLLAAFNKHSEIRILKNDNLFKLLSPLLFAGIGVYLFFYY